MVGDVLVGVAFVPGPPIVVPEVSVAAAPETAPLRAAGDAAVGGLVRAGASRLVIVGVADRPATPSGPLPVDATGDLRGFGVDLAVALDPARPDGPRVLPRSLVVGTWWCERAAPGPRRGAWVLSDDAEPDELRDARRPDRLGA